MKHRLRPHRDDLAGLWGGASIPKPKTRSFHEHEASVKDKTPFQFEAANSCARRANSVEGVRIVEPLHEVAASIKGLMIKLISWGAGMCSISCTNRIAVVLFPRGTKLRVLETYSWKELQVRK